MRNRCLWILRSFLLALATLGNARAAVSIYLSPEGVAAIAPVAFEGTVTAVDTGYDPVTAGIATYVTVDVTRVLRGPLAPGRVVLRERGGVFGELVHECEASATYAPGEQVVVFAEAARDGALRTAAGFFGKFALVPSAGTTENAERRLRGRGLILRGPAEPDERFARDDLTRLAEAGSTARRGNGCSAASCLREPAELGRLLWNSRRLAQSVAPSEGGPGAASAGALARSSDADNPARVEFAPLSSATPARWDEMDAGATISIDVERARDPLGNGAAALAEIERALAAWNAVPEARASLRVGNGNASFTPEHAFSPADVYPPSNIVLFGDPYDDLSDPVSCSGTLAYGGYWRSASRGRLVNGVQYYPIRRSYVIFNRNFECFLGLPPNLAEIATHELGHGLGFGHSSVTGSVMRGWPYGGRGAALGDDDRNAAHCVYPHTFVVTQPNGGESWKSGTSQAIRWSSTVDSGAAAGSVDIDLSLDAGATWSSIITGTPNDGSFDWSIAAAPSTQARVRVGRRTLPVSGMTGTGVCSQDTSNAAFTIAPPAAPAGTLPATGAGALTLLRTASGQINLSWGGSCGVPSGYVVYEGSLAALAGGTWDHKPVRCGSGSARTQSVDATGPDRYYLVAASTALAEGPLGAGSSGAPRPISAFACAPREPATCP